MFILVIVVKKKKKLNGTYGALKYLPEKKKTKQNKTLCGEGYVCKINSEFLKITLCWK
jgi:hypothetical protein